MSGTVLNDRLSTVAVQLAAWGHAQGRRTALVDADAQGASSVWLHEAEPAIPISRLQTPDEILDQVPRLATQFEEVNRYESEANDEPVVTRG